MSYIEPNSTIYIFREDDGGSPIPFDPSMENTIYFPDRENQLEYMMAYNPIILTKNSYTRVSRGVIKIGLDSLNDNAIASLYNANYMAFINESFENKYFYAFVDTVEYLNNNTVTLAFHIDPIQTYMFDWIFNQCLIEREHTVSDLLGEHTLPEGLETGPYRSIPASVYLQDPLSPTGESFMYNRFEYRRCVVVATTLDVDSIIASGGTISGRPKYSYGVIIPGAAGYGGGGEYYSGVRYNVFLIESEPTQGIYEMMFGGHFNEGDIIEVADVSITLSAAQAHDEYSVALAVADKIFSESTIYSAQVDQSDRRIVLISENNGYYGSGIPTVTTNSERGIYVIRTLVPGTDGSLSEINKLNRFFSTIASSNLESAVLGAFMMPYEFYPKGEQLTEGVSPLYMRVPFPSNIGNPPTVENPDPGYKPRNMKLFCSPYNELYVTNNSGNEAQYRFEDFSSAEKRDSCMFSIWGNLSMNPGMYCAPMFYNGNGYMSGAVDDELVLSGFPMCSFTIDSFRAWLSQNAGVIGATAGSLLAGWTSLVSGTIGFTSAPLAGKVGSNLPQLQGQVGKQKLEPFADINVSQPSGGLIAATLGALGSLYDHSRRPPQSHGACNGNLTYQAGQLTFSWYYKQIKPEYAEIIDKFFDMYGYKTNRVGVPNIAARPRYTYVKTVGCSVDGHIPADMRLAIEKIFDKGIRFWTTEAVFGNYDPDVNNNRPVSGGE